MSLYAPKEELFQACNTSPPRSGSSIISRYRWEGFLCAVTEHQGWLAGYLNSGRGTIQIYDLMLIHRWNTTKFWNMWKSDGPPKIADSSFFRLFSWLYYSSWTYRWWLGDVDPPQPRFPWFSDLLLPWPLSPSIPNIVGSQPPIADR